MIDSAIEQWEFHDYPEHLTTIRDRELRIENRAVQLLRTYQQVLEEGSVPAHNSSQNLELCLSGLVTKRNDRLYVYNRIYASVFNRDWVVYHLSMIRPYAAEIQRWLVSSRQDDSALLQEDALEMALAWKEGKLLSQQDYEFLEASQRIEKRTLQTELKTEQAHRQLQPKPSYDCMLIAKRQSRWLWVLLRELQLRDTGMR